jgi:hypothetical protein
MWQQCYCGHDFGPPEIDQRSTEYERVRHAPPFSQRSRYNLALGALLVAAFIRWYPDIKPASSYAQLLESSDSEQVMSGLYHLTKRANPIAVPGAIELLSHEDDYIWLNAALYLGACRRPEAVPFLIKALRHTAWRADSDTAQYLRAITGADFGTDFSRWQQWWLVRHPDFALNWESHLGPLPRIATPK